jgi:hypothetical protein
MAGRLFAEDFAKALVGPLVGVLLVDVLERHHDQAGREECRPDMATGNAVSQFQTSVPPANAQERAVQRPLR